MKGLDLSRDYFFNCVKPLLRENLPEIQNGYAAGLVGYGSDVIGNDDEMSQDHEWGPRCHIFLTEDGHARYGARLNDLLNDKLPIEFKGFSTRFHLAEYLMSVPGKDKSGYHHIAITTPKRFLELTIGYPGVPVTDFDWLTVSEQRLLEFTAGEVFEDTPGELTSLRKQLAYFPDDVWRFRISYILKSLGEEDDVIEMCGIRNDRISMYLCTARTVERIMKLVFLLNRKYMPYAKWLHREFKKLPENVTDIESDLLTMLELRDHHGIIEALNRVYDKVLLVMNGQGLCKSYPAKFKRPSSGIYYDIQTSAADVLAGIKGELKELVIDDFPIGSIDQWMNNNDIVLSAEHMKSLSSVYKAKQLKRQGLGDLLI